MDPSRHIRAGHLPAVLVVVFQVAPAGLGADPLVEFGEQRVGVRVVVGETVGETVSVYPSSLSPPGTCSIASALIPPGVRHSRNRNR